MPLMGETGQQGGGLMPLEAVSLPWPEEVIHNLYQPRTCPRERLKTDALESSWTRQVPSGRHLIIPGHENASFPLYHAGMGDLLRRKMDPGREIKLWPGPYV